MVVFDSWALLAYLGGEPAAGRIESIWLEESAAICSVNLGEVLYIRIRQSGEESAGADVESVRGLLEVIDPDWALVSTAAWSRQVAVSPTGTLSASPRPFVSRHRFGPETRRSSSRRSTTLVRSSTCGTDR